MPLQNPAEPSVKVQNLLIAAGTAVHMLLLHAALLQLLSVPAGKLHWLLCRQPTQLPLPLQNPAEPAFSWQALLAAAGTTMQVMVVALHTALLQLLSVPGGKLHWLLCRQPTQLPLPLQNPGTPPVSVHCL